jgi:hypothetical protein
MDGQGTMEISPFIYKKEVVTDFGEIASYSKWSFAFTEAGGALRKLTGK